MYDKVWITAFFFLHGNFLEWINYKISVYSISVVNKKSYRIILCSRNDAIIKKYAFKNYIKKSENSHDLNSQLKFIRYDLYGNYKFT